MIIRMQPGGIWFGCPTFCDAIPVAEEDRADGKVLRLSEEDWRGVELVHLSQADAVEGTLEEVAEAHRHRAGRGAGFDRVAVRGEPRNPLTDKGIDFPGLVEALGPVEWLDGVGYENGGVIRTGFACRDSGGLITYGVVRDSRAVEVAFTGQPSEVFDSLLERLAPLLQRESLMLVDWWRLRRGNAAAGE